MDFSKLSKLIDLQKEQDSTQQTSVGLFGIEPYHRVQYIKAEKDLCSRKDRPIELSKPPPYNVMVELTDHLGPLRSFSWVGNTQPEICAGLRLQKLC